MVQLTILPPVEELQTDPSTRGKWIDYSAYDAKATWQLAQALRKQLMVSHLHHFTSRLSTLKCLMRASPSLPSMWPQVLLMTATWSMQGEDLELLLVACTSMQDKVSCHRRCWDVIWKHDICMQCQIMSSCHHQASSLSELHAATILGSVFQLLLCLLWLEEDAYLL